MGKFTRLCTILLLACGPVAAAQDFAAPDPSELFPPPGKAQPPAELARCLVKVHVGYHDYEGNAGGGDLIVNRDLAPDVIKVFALMERLRFPVRSVKTIDRFSWDDEASMLADNTSSYNYRPITGGHTLSNHATGRAIDINPYCNPYFRNGVSDPPGTRHDPAQPCALDGEKGKEILEAFERLGWKWGGSWSNPVDYQHFEKAADPGLAPAFCR